jgi:3-hydroxybutyryl-CoA dehydrogenase
MAIRKVGVIGCGLMGSGIVQVSAECGYETVVKEIDQKFLDKGLSMIQKNLEKGVEKGKLTEDFKKKVLDKIKGTLKDGDLAECDLVVEAIVEEIETKKQLFTDLDKTCKPSAIFATNTSSLRVTEMAAATNRPERMVGMHFFNPVQVMKLVEIVKTLVTPKDVLEEVYEFCRGIKKVAILAKDSPGFIVNRLLAPYFVETVKALERGLATVEDIDNGMRLGSGYPMGPLTLLDFVGIDTVYRALSSMYEEFKEPQFAPPPLMKKMVLLNYLGRKTGKGFYDYSVDPPKVNELNI